MLGKSIPNGNGRLSLALMDALLKRLVASGVFSQADLDAVLADAQAAMEAERSISSEAALMVLHTSRIGV
jgi:hypothetical protein